MGPLEGVRIVELGGIGPAPMCAMLLADLGADVIRVERRGAPPPLGIPEEFQLLNRSRTLIEVDLKSDEGREAVLALVERADALIEGFRPGVPERLRVGPDDCAARNPRLVYGRMTGWGQEGPLAQVAGHDINYISLVGALAAIGPADGPPVPPLSLVGDYGGGALYLALGILAAVIEAKRSGRGQVVDAAMIDGAASLMTVVYGMRAAGLWQDERGANYLDGGAPFYACYETKDRKWISIGPLEPQFWAELVKRLGLEPSSLPDRDDRAVWPALREKLARVFREKTRDEWVALLGETDTCFAPVLDLAEAPSHPHVRARHVRRGRRRRAAGAGTTVQPHAGSDQETSGSQGGRSGGSASRVRVLGKRARAASRGSGIPMIGREGLAVEHRGKALWITITRPERRNALDRETIGALRDAILGSEKDDECRVVVLGGAGGAFSTGADLQAVKDSPTPPGDEGLETLYNATISAIWNLPKPVIAAVGGIAAGYGASLAFASDVCVASSEARFALSFVKRGLALDGGASFFLPLLAGLRGMEMALTGDVIDAAEAYRLGLVNRVIPAEEFGTKVAEIAAKLVANAPLAIAEIKRAVHMRSTDALEAMLAHEMSVVRRLVKTDDFQEGMNSFLEKRPPVFRGK